MGRREDSSPKTLSVKGVYSSIVTLASEEKPKLDPRTCTEDLNEWGLSHALLGDDLSISAARQGRLSSPHSASGGVESLDARRVSPSGHCCAKSASAAPGGSMLDEGGALHFVPPPCTTGGNSMQCLPRSGGRASAGPLTMERCGEITNSPALRIEASHPHRRRIWATSPSLLYRDDFCARRRRAITDMGAEEFHAERRLGRDHRDPDAIPCNLRAPAGRSQKEPLRVARKPQLN